MAEGRVEVRGQLVGAAAVKSSIASPAAASTVVATTISPPPSIGTRAAPSESRPIARRTAGGGVLLHEGHVAGDRVRAIGRDHLGDRRGAGLAGGDLGLEVGDVAVRRAGGPAAGGEGGAGLGLQEAALAHDRQGVEHDAFLVDGLGERRHRARLHPADVGMVAAGGDVEGGLRVAASMNTGMTTVMSGRWVPPA